MYEQVEKPKDNKGRAVTNSISLKKGNCKQFLKDNRRANSFSNKTISINSHAKMPPSAQAIQRVIKKNDSAQDYDILERIKHDLSESEWYQIMGNKELKLKLNNWIKDKSIVKYLADVKSLIPSNISQENFEEAKNQEELVTTEIKTEEDEETKYTLDELLEKELKYKFDLSSISGTNPGTENNQSFLKMKEYREDMGKKLEEEYLEPNEKQDLDSWLDQIKVTILRETHGVTPSAEMVKGLDDRKHTLVSLEYDESRYNINKDVIDGKYPEETANDQTYNAVNLKEATDTEGMPWLYADTGNAKVGTETPMQQLKRRNYKMTVEIYKKLLEEYINNHFTHDNRVNKLFVHVGFNHDNPEKCADKGTISNFLKAMGIGGKTPYSKKE